MCAGREAIRYFLSLDSDKMEKSTQSVRKFVQLLCGAFCSATTAKTNGANGAKAALKKRMSIDRGPCLI